MYESNIKRCCVIGCPHNTKNNPCHSFFRFPVAKERYVEWLEAINRQDILRNGFKIASYRICESHFEPSTILRHKAFKRLAKNTKPTLNLAPLDVESSNERRNGAESSIGFQTKQDDTGLFTIPSKKIKLATCQTEIVSITPEPMFKYRNLTVSAIKIIDCHQNNPLRIEERTMTVKNSEDNCIDVSNIKTEIPEHDLISSSNSNNSGEPVNTIYIPEIKTEPEIQTLFRASHQNLIKVMNSTKNQRLDSKEILDKNLLNFDHSSTERGRQIVSIRPINDNILELAGIQPHGYKNTETLHTKSLEIDEDNSMDMKIENDQDVIDISETEFIINK